MDRKLAAVIGLLSAGAIAFEIALTRAFSLLFQYHFAFLAASLAVLGLSIGTAVVRLMRVSSERAAPALWRALLLSSLAFPVAAVGLATIPTTTTVALHVAVALVPFSLAGAALALAFSLKPQASGALYAADLIAAAIGIVAALALLSLVGPFNLTLIVGMCGAIAALILDWPRPKLAAIAQPTAHAPAARGVAAPVLAFTLCAGLLAFNLSVRTIDDAPLRLADPSPDKTLLRVLNERSLDARVVHSAWDPIARVDVVETRDPDVKYAFADAGAGSFMLRFDGDLGKVVGLRETVEYLPFAHGSVDKTLVLGAGAGKDVLLAKLAGSAEIAAVEVNAATVAATRAFDAFTGRIFDQPGVRLHIGDARHFVESSTEAFDLIYLNVVYSQAAPPASQALVENYAFTQRAFRAYLERLNDGGRLAIIAHNGIEGTRAAITAIAALGELGVAPAQALDHIAVLMRNNPDPTQRPTAVIVSRQPLTPALLDALRADARALGMQPLHLPGAFELGFQPLKNGQSLQDFLNVDKSYDLFPASDDRPFFYKLDPGVPSPISQALIAAAGLAVLMAIALARRDRRMAPAPLVYVAAIGAGFMLIEVPLIQRFQLLLGAPVLSFALVLGVLLVAGGLGSGFSQRWPAGPEHRPLMRRAAAAAAVVAALGLAYLFALPPITQVAAGWPLIARVGLIVAATAPLGFAMGIPFPTVLRTAGVQAEGNVALIWAVNGAFSVVGSTLAMWLALAAGFSWAMAAGVAAYAVVAVIARQRMGAG